VRLDPSNAVRRHHHDLAHPKETTARDGGAVAGVTPAGHARMAVRRVAELGRVLHRQRQARVRAHVAALARRASKWDVVRRRRNNLESIGRYRKTGCRRAAVALCAVRARRGRVGVDRRDRGHYRKVRARVARGARRRRRHRYVVVGHTSGSKVYEAAVTVGAVSTGGVGCVHIREGGQFGALRAGLEALEWRARRDRVLRHAHPQVARFVATRAVACHPGVDHRRRRRWRQKTTPRRRLGRHPRHQSRGR